MRVLRFAVNIVALALAALGALAPTRAEAQADFYKGKNIDLVISTGVGGGLDANARVVAKHLGNHIPGSPTIVPKNMPGAGHIKAANFVFNVAPKDGTVIATFIPVFVLAQVLDRGAAQFDPAKFNWLASTSSNNSTIWVWHTAGVNSIEDATKKQVLMGSTGVGSYTMIYPTVMNSVVGTKFKLISGYQSAADVGLAIERGEVQGRAGNNFNSLKVENGEWFRSGKIKLIAQVGLERDPEFPNLPLMSDFAKTDADRQILKLFSTDVVIGRPFVTSPGVPVERVALLRKAFDDMMKDPAFLQDAATAGLDVTPVDGVRIQKIVEDLVATPADIVAKAKLAMEPKGEDAKPVGKDDKAQ
jgi:tripartite-type tricarboxylate transporter receptor subunit TctC